jgi:uncharacterized protein (DUF2132 family)
VLDFDFIHKTLPRLDPLTRQRKSALSLSLARLRRLTLPASMQSKDPLHGITLEKIVTELVARHGWEELGRRIEVRCFTHDPSVKSSLTFLRKTPWARKKVEDLYLRGLR